MNTSIKITIVSFLFFVTCSCKFFEDGPQPRTIVFCDFTSSVDSVVSIEKIKNDASEILKREAKERKLEFYSIGKDNNSNCLYSSPTLVPEPRPSDIEEFDSAAPSRANDLWLALEKASSNAAMINRREPSSCIMDAVERAIGYFRNESDFETASLHLYLLSDMLECCRLNGKEKICIENLLLPYDSIDTKIRQYADSTQSFKGMNNLKVFIVQAASKKGEGTATELKRFWERVFRYYGYTQPLYFSVNLPSK